MIKKKHIYFNEYAKFAGKKLSANVDNTKYNYINDTTIRTGEPEIMYQSIVYFRDVPYMWTHAKLWKMVDEDTLSKLAETETKYLEVPELPNPMVDGSVYQMRVTSELYIHTPTSNRKGIVVYFTTSPEGCTLMFDEQTPSWIGGDPGALDANTPYMLIAIDNKYAINPIISQQ